MLILRSCVILIYKNKYLLSCYLFSTFSRLFGGQKGTYRSLRLAQVDVFQQLVFYYLIVTDCKSSTTCLIFFYDQLALAASVAWKYIKEVAYIHPYRRQGCPLSSINERLDLSQTTKATQIYIALFRFFVSFFSYFYKLFQIFI